MRCQACAHGTAGARAADQNARRSPRGSSAPPSRRARGGKPPPSTWCRVGQAAICWWALCPPHRALWLAALARGRSCAWPLLRSRALLQEGLSEVRCQDVCVCVCCAQEWGGVVDTDAAEWKIVCTASPDETPAVVWPLCPAPPVQGCGKRRLSWVPSPEGCACSSEQGGGVAWRGCWMIGRSAATAVYWGEA